MDNRKLIDKALEAMNYAYAPYSKFKVGAALITDGVVYTGCNIENSSFGATICAERCAISKAVSEGHKNIQKIVLYQSQKENISLYLDSWFYHYIFQSSKKKDLALSILNQHMHWYI